MVHHARQEETDQLLTTEGTQEEYGASTAKNLYSPSTYRSGIDGAAVHRSAGEGISLCIIAYRRSLSPCIHPQIDRLERRSIIFLGLSGS
jgi:hypothetical protein